MTRPPLGHFLTHLRTAPAADAPADRELLRRFTEAGDGDAFAALVRRHRRAVLAACRQVLSDPAAIDDAFQATFLVLLQKARTVPWRATFGSWLYAVAHRVAVKARAQARRRRERETAAAGLRPTAAPPPDPSWHEACALLHAELDRLPDRYRLPLLLCYLEGLSREEAARRLGWTAGAVKGRLERGRRALAARLARRGLTLSAGLLAAVAGTARATVALPDLVERTMQAVQGRPRQAVAALAQSAMAVRGAPGKLLTAVAAFGLAVALLLPAAQSPGQKAPPPAPTAAASRPPDEAPVAMAVTFAGRVLSTDGRPLPGASVLVGGISGNVEFTPRTTAGPDGTFRFTVRPEEFGGRPATPDRIGIGAVAEGYGAVATGVAASDQRERISLRLPAEEIVRGRVLTPEGQPAAGVQVMAQGQSGYLDEQGQPVPYDAPARPGLRYFRAPYVPQWHQVRTDQDGRFTIRGLTRGWLYDLYFRGPTVVSANAKVVARPQPPATLEVGGMPKGSRMPQVPLYGSTLTHVALPSKPITGRVTDAGTGQPLAGVRIQRFSLDEDKPRDWATTDAEGRYTLTGLPPGVYVLEIHPAEGTPFLLSRQKVEADQPGIGPATFDLALARQRTATGRIVDAGTGRPVRSRVEYRPLAGNPHVKDHPLLAAPLDHRAMAPSVAAADGQFTLPVLPGPGVLLVSGAGDYLPARLAPEDRRPGVAHPEDPELLDCRPRPAWPAFFQDYYLLDVPAAAPGVADLRLRLQPDHPLPLRLEFADGKPCDLTMVGGQGDRRVSGQGLPAGTPAVIRGLARGENHWAFLLTTDDRLGGAVRVEGGAPGPIPVRLQPTGEITGRLLNAQGQPQADAGFQVVYRDGPDRAGVILARRLGMRKPTPAEVNRHRLTYGYPADGTEHVHGPEKTDAQGRFRIAGLIPDASFDLVAIVISATDAQGQRRIQGTAKVATATLKPGAALDLGDLQVSGPLEK